MVRNKDVALQAGVSVATVSRVMNQNGYVKEETKRIVMKAFNDLVSEDRLLGQSISTKKSNVIGVVIPDLSNPFFGDVIKGISEIADKHNASMLVCNTEEQIEKELRYLDLLKTHDIMWLIITPKTDQEEYNAKYLSKLEYLNVPIVLLDRGINLSHYNSVFVNNVSGSFDAINALINEGHTDIAIISGPMSSKPGRDRFYGFENAMRVHNIPVNEEYVRYGNFKLQSGYELTNQLLQLKKRPTAIFVSNNMMAQGCIKSIIEHNLSIPKDIAFVSFDDVDMFEIMNLNISTVSRPTKLMGEVACDMLFDLINNGPEKQKSIKEVLLETKLVLRGSEKRIRR